jgi:hypothetical protein
MADADLLERLRTDLPRLLREHPEVRHELWGLMLEAFPSRQEFLEVLHELRAFREETGRRLEELRADMDRRFEAMDRRFEAVDRRFEAMDRRFEAMLVELRHQRLMVSTLGVRVGFGIEGLVKAAVEEFAGASFPAAERLILEDVAGELYGVPGAKVEFDLYAHNGTAYLVEVKSHVKPGDVLMFHRKAAFAEARLGRPVIRLMLALSVEPRAAALMQELGIRHRFHLTTE